MLTPQQRRRYDRQLLIPGIGEAGQEKLLASSALIVGAGGLGSPCAYYLAAAGVGRIGVADADAVELSNLNRQILHASPDLGRPKTESARERLAALNPEVRVETICERVTDANAPALIAAYDVVVDAADNFETKYLLNDACVRAGKPLVHAGVLGLSGQCLAVAPGGACLRCVFPEPPPAGALPGPRDAGVLGAAAGALGCVQAVETVKLLLGLGRPLMNRLLIYDGLGGEWVTIDAARDPQCRACGDAARREAKP